MMINSNSIPNSFSLNEADLFTVFVYERHTDKEDSSFISCIASFLLLMRSKPWCWVWLCSIAYCKYKPCPCKPLNTIFSESPRCSVACSVNCACSVGSDFSSSVWIFENLEEGPWWTWYVCNWHKIKYQKKFLTVEQK